MRIIRQNLTTFKIITFLLLFLITCNLIGCTRIQHRGIKVLPAVGQNTLNLTANDVVNIMRAAGFTDQQIYEYGTAVHDGIAQMGAAQISIDGNVEAIFMVKGEDIFITTMSRGLFIYNIRTGWSVSNMQ